MIKFFKDVRFEIVNRYLTIDSSNNIFTLALIDRDSPEFTSINGILKAWVKITNKIRPDILNYFKVNLVIFGTVCFWLIFFYLDNYTYY